MQNLKRFAGSDRAVFYNFSTRYYSIYIYNFFSIKFTRKIILKTRAVEFKHSIPKYSIADYVTSIIKNEKLRW